MGYVPVFILILATFGLMVKKSMSSRLNVIKGLGGLVAETFTAMRVVVAFTGELIEIRKMSYWIGETEKVGKRAQLMTSIMVALMKLSVFLYYTYAFFIGSIFVQKKFHNSRSNGPYDSEDVLAVLIAFITGFITLVAALPNVQAIMASKFAGKIIFDIIDREPVISNSQQS